MDNHLLSKYVDKKRVVTNLIVFKFKNLSWLLLNIEYKSFYGYTSFEVLNQLSHRVIKLIFSLIVVCLKLNYEGVQSLFGEPTNRYNTTLKNTL